MSTYVVGDLQGCLQPLLCLLEQVAFNPQKDKLWCTGDLVNRGPESLAALRFIHSLGDACITVLGNHDLHLLAVAYGNASLKPADTLQEILDAPDSSILLDWLRHQPLIHHENNFTLVHAGIAPQWSVSEAMQYAHEVETALRSENFTDFLNHMYGNQPDVWQDNLTGHDRLRVITNYLTRMRFCYADGRLDLKNKLGAEHAKEGTYPWFKTPGRIATNNNIVFGHWAALLGQANTPHVYALDTGCIWGGSLTLLRIEDVKLFSCQCAN
jgi:bis(5'-nucleosyl)-tetraphosphatase (symmetrical)